MTDEEPTLREHLEQQIKHERELRQAAQREADRRFDEVGSLKDRIVELENYTSTLTGRAAAFGVVGAVFVAVSSAVITRVIFGG
jgi:hypothetical protein